MESLIRKHYQDWSGYISEVSYSPGECLSKHPESQNSLLLVSWGRAVQSIEPLCSGAIEISRFEKGSLIDLTSVCESESGDFRVTADTILEGWLINKGAFSESSIMPPLFRHELSDRIVARLDKKQPLLEGAGVAEVLELRSTNTFQEQSHVFSSLTIGKQASMSFNNLLDDGKNRALKVFDTITKFSCT